MGRPAAGDPYVSVPHPRRPLWLACALALGVWCGSAQALSLGRLTMLSKLGEPLRAEVDLNDLSPTEAASLRTQVASPDAFKLARLDYNAVLASLVFDLQRRADGRAVLRLSSVRSVQEPIVDLLLEASWSGGRIVREYTLLLDPPATALAPPSGPQLPLTSPLPMAAPAQQPTATQPAPAQAQASPALTDADAAQPTPPSRPLATQTAQAAQTQPNTRPVPPAKATRAAPPAAPSTQQASRPATRAQARPAAAPPAAQATPARPAPTAQRLRVRSGDTAAAIARAHKPANVSLDQMLVALLHDNPQAFIADNVNRLKAGAVLDLPGAAQATQTAAPEAHAIIVAQSEDFNAYRRKLAQQATRLPAQALARSASGQITAAVQDKAPGPTAPDKLTLSKPSVHDAPPAAESQLAKRGNAHEAQARQQALQDNIAALKKLAAQAQQPASAGPAGPASRAPAAQTSPPASAAAVSAASAPLPAASTAQTATSQAPDASAALPSAAAASRPASAASAPVSRPKPAAAPTPEPAAQPGVLDSLLDNPLLPLAGAGLLSLLGGLAWLQVRRRRAQTVQDPAPIESAFPDSALAPDSLIDASGGRSVDTTEGPGGSTGSSMVYSSSQLDAVEGVDPVAEADVYIAYGRDLQAEEILRDALRNTPDRVAIHVKLAEIYAKRADPKSFEASATLVYNLVDGQGPDWDKVCQLGRALDPSNPLYQNGAAPSADPAPLSAAASEHIADEAALPPIPGGELDLDLDFSADLSAATAPAPLAQSSATESPAELAAAQTYPDLGQPLAEFAAAATQPDPAPSPANLDLPPLDFPAPPSATPDPAPAPVQAGLNLPDLAFEPTHQQTVQSTPETAESGAGEPTTESPSLEPSFDLGELALDLGDTPSTQTPADDGPADPLETKLALAEEFKAIGDDDGARALIEEVLAEASGDLKARAQTALNQL